MTSLAAAKRYRIIAAPREHPTQQKARLKPGFPRFYASYATPTASLGHDESELGGLVEGLGDAVLDRFGGLGGNRLRDGGQFLALGSNGFKLLAGMRGGELDQF